MLTLLLGFGLNAVFAQSSTSPEVAKINDRVIHLDEFNRKYNDMSRTQPYQVPTRAAILEQVVDRELILQAAQKQGLAQDPEVKERMDALLYQAYLAKNLGEKMVRASPSEKQLMAFYETVPEIRTSHIFISLKPGSDAATEAAAMAKIKKIETLLNTPGVDGVKPTFAQVAQQYSEGLAAAVGGDLDFQTRDKLDANYYEAALALKTPGKITGIVRSAFGLHLIRLTAIRPWKDTDQAYVRRLYMSDTERKAIAELAKGLRKSATVTTHPDRLGGY